MLDSHGNREFAAYLREVTAGADTKVELVKHSRKITLKTGRKKRSESSLGDIVRDIETELLEIPGFLYNAESAQGDVVAASQAEFGRQFVGDMFASSENQPASYSRKQKSSRRKETSYLLPVTGLARPSVTLWLFILLVSWSITWMKPTISWGFSCPIGRPVTLSSKTRG